MLECWVDWKLCHFHLVKSRRNYPCWFNFEIPRLNCQAKYFPEFVRLNILGFCPTWPSWTVQSRKETWINSSEFTTLMSLPFLRRLGSTNILESLLRRRIFVSVPRTSCGGTDNRPGPTAGGARKLVRISELIFRDSCLESVLLRHEAWFYDVFNKSCFNITLCPCPLPFFAWICYVFNLNVSYEASSYGRLFGASEPCCH